MTLAGAFCDPTSPPSEVEVRTKLESAWPRWRRLEDWIGERYGIRGEPLFTGRVSGWAVRFRRSGKALLTLSPQAAGGFRALVVIGPSAWSAVAELELGPALREAWANARPYPDGRWLFVQVDDDRTADDIRRLVELKSPPPRRPRPLPVTPVPA
ncbi:MAG TPA: DUF3788 family protein [Candidatus Deferrimicrobium sp.]|nr:DUF3788 family protein [Candidatus Deferrimicrobium sp.]